MKRLVFSTDDGCGGVEHIASVFKKARYTNDFYYIFNKALEIRETIEACCEFTNWKDQDLINKYMDSVSFYYYLSKDLPASPFN